MNLINDINIAKDLILNKNNSIVVINNGVLLTEKIGDGIKPIIESINELKDKINGSVIGDKILGKASALLCIYSKARAVYSPKSTNAAISLLSRKGIYYETDKVIPFIKNKYKNDICPFEKIVENIESPNDAYKILIDKYDKIINLNKKTK